MKFSFNIIGDEAQTNAWQHEIIKSLTNIKLRITGRKLNNKNICSNILKAEMRNCDFPNHLSKYQIKTYY